MSSQFNNHIGPSSSSAKSSTRDTQAETQHIVSVPTSHSKTFNYKRFLPCIDSLCSPGRRYWGCLRSQTQTPVDEDWHDTVLFHGKRVPNGNHILVQSEVELTTELSTGKLITENNRTFFGRAWGRFTRLNCMRVDEDPGCASGHSEKREDSWVPSKTEGSNSTQCYAAGSVAG
jgi:hypothetical protein